MSAGPQKLIREHWLFLVLTCLWLAAHMYVLPQKALEHDEFYSVLAAGGRSAEIQEHLNSEPLVQSRARDLLGYLEYDPRTSIVSFLKNLAANDIHPPTFFLALRYWLIAGGSSPAWLSLLSLCISLAALLMLYRLSISLIEKPYHLLPALLWMISIHGWDLDAQVRQYCLLLLLSVLALSQSIAIYREPQRIRRPRTLGLLGLTLALGFLTQYIFLFLILALDCWMLLNPKMRSKDLLLGWIKANLVCLVLVLPWLPFALGQFSGQVGHQIPAPDLGQICLNLLRMLVHMVTYPPALLSLPGLLVAMLYGIGIARPPFQGFKSLLVLCVACCMVLPALLLWLGILNIRHLFSVRYFITAAPILLLLIAQGIAAIPYHKLRAGVALLLLVIVAINSASFISLDLESWGGSLPSARSHHPVLMRYLENNLPEDFVIAMDVRRSASVLMITSQVSPERTLLIGDCPSLPESLAQWTEHNRPPVIYLLHARGTRAKPITDCTREVADALAPAYIMPKQQGRIRQWAGVYFVSTANPE